MVKFNKKIKFDTKSSILYREIKKATRSAKGVLAENRRLKKENSIMINTIAALQDFSRPVEEHQHHLYVDREEHGVLLLDPQEPAELLFGGVGGVGGNGGGEIPQRNINNYKRYEPERHNNTIEVVDDGDYRFVCDGLLLLDDEEELVNYNGSGGSAIVAAAATMLSFSK